MFDWTPERISKLRGLIANGESAGMIAGQLGQVSRSAVMGKAFRLGLRLTGQEHSYVGRVRRPEREPKRSKSATVAPIHQHTVRRIAERAKDIKPQPVCEVPADKRMSLDNLERDSCRWPLGDPGQPDFGYCGGRARDGHSYCAPHCRMAYETPAQRKIRRAEWRADQKTRAA